MDAARIYQRVNGDFGASCDGCADTGHHIVKTRDRYTVYSVHDLDKPIATDASLAAAIDAIENDWRKGEQ